MARRYLLSIDGGGVRGIIPICALIELERLTGRPARATFSFLAGTSTGAIIAAGLAAGVPALQLLDLYLARVPEIFARRPWTIPKRILLGWMYSTSRLHAVLAEALGGAREMRLNDAGVDLLITAKRVRDGLPWYFVKNNDRNSQRTGHLRLLDCVTASAAEPTYFQPWTIAESETERPAGSDPIGQLTGGGVGVAGNPVYQACIEAFYYTPAYAPSDTLVVSLGTGRFVNRPRPGWIGAWFDWVLGELLRSPGEQQTEIVQRHFPKMPFYRIDPDVSVLDPERGQGMPLDDTSRLEELRALGTGLAATIDWATILDGGDSPFRVTAKKTQWPEYKQAVPRRSG